MWRQDEIRLHAPETNKIESLLEDIYLEMWEALNLEGKGPYIATTNNDWMINDHYDNEYHPDIMHDFWYDKYTWVGSLYVDEQIEEKGLVFGFRSMEELNSWFCYQELLNLEKLGFSIKAFSAQPVFGSNKQCIFIKP